MKQRYNVFGIVFVNGETELSFRKGVCFTYGRLLHN